MTQFFIALTVVIAGLSAHAGDLSDAFAARQNSADQQRLAESRARSLAYAAKLAERKAKSRVVSSEVTSSGGELTYTFQMQSGVLCQVGFGFNDQSSVTCY